MLQLISTLANLETTHPFNEGVAGIKKVDDPGLPPSDYRMAECGSNLHAYGSVTAVDDWYLKKFFYEVFRKAEFHDPDLDPLEEAIRSFLTKMEQMRENNRLFSSLVVEMKTREPALYRSLLKAREVCHELFGDFRRVVESGHYEWSFSEGACIGYRNQSIKLARGNTPIDRLSHLSFNSDLVPVILTHLNAMYTQRNHHYERHGGLRGLRKHGSYISPLQLLATGNNIGVSGVTTANFVPKTFKTDRPVFMEPSGDAIVQSTFGKILREVLSRHGLDLSTLPERHVEIARESSVDGKYATIDLSGGSDNIYLQLADFLIPNDVFDLLTSVRSDTVLFPKSKKIPEKYRGQKIDLPILATAGNGVCFPCETIVFYSLAVGVCSEHYSLIKQSNYAYEGVTVRKMCSVFGDDIIIPTPVAEHLIRLFEILGLAVNRDKSYYNGHFRESCGGHFYKGFDVSFPHLKRVLELSDMTEGDLQNNKKEVFKYANIIKEFCYTRNDNVWRHPFFSSLYNNLLYHFVIGSPFHHWTESDDIGIRVPDPWDRCTPVVYRPKTNNALPRAHCGFTVRKVPVFFKDEIFLSKHTNLPVFNIRGLTTYESKKKNFYTKVQQNPLDRQLLCAIAGSGLLKGSGLVDITCKRLDDTQKSEVRERAGYRVKFFDTEETTSYQVYPDVFSGQEASQSYRATRMLVEGIESEEVPDSIWRRFDETRFARYYRNILAMRRKRIIDVDRKAELSTKYLTRLVNGLAVIANQKREDVQKRFS